ncbi:MAG: peptide ABC transporter substrate-binding protein, partial [Candidatus Thermofonsia bacterium]
YALDKELLARTFGSGMTIAANGPLPPGLPGSHPDLTGYPYDPERARALLAEAGYADPADMPPLTYTTSGYGDVGPFVTAVITMWQENLGVTIQPETIDPFEYYNELFSGNMGHFFDSGWCADYPDPQNFLDVLYQSSSQQNLSGYANAELDALLAQAAVETDVAERLRLYGRAEEMVTEGAPVVFLSHSVTAVLVKPRVQNYHLTPIGIPQWHRISLTTAAEN